ncbi:MAG: aminotransferase class V-fold PLP-dependent enzyme [Anaerolineales bacterium]|nr:aminotransferase class V-fold PLP-dependent enzyme [Anaerolineales bacterium]
MIVDRVTSQNDMKNGLESALRQFLRAYPEYEATRRLDELRATEYARLDAQAHIYLDYAGGGLYAESQLQKHMELLREHVFGNPHSSNPSSLAATRLVEQARRSVLEFFNALPDEYVPIFTSNASGALKLVGESFPFEEKGRYLLTFDNHNSVNGIREFARARGAEITYVPVELPDMRVDETKLDGYLDLARPGGNNLFAFPAQSNFSGVQHPLDWIEKAHSKGWSVLLDAGAFAPTNRLDLSRWRPDFVPLSFYKMFGYPTGVGCLLARKSALARLRRPWFAGGTITVASVQGDKYYLAPGEAAFEEGTLNYLNIPAVEIGLNHLRSIGMQAIHERVRCLSAWLLENLLALEHRNGKPFARLYGPTTTEQRGGTLALNFFDAAGNAIDHRSIEQQANRANISLRTGCFCNPGAGEIAMELSRPELVACFTRPTERLSMDDFRLCIDNRNFGAVRISTGLASNFADAYGFVQFAKGLLA